MARHASTAALLGLGASGLLALQAVRASRTGSDGTALGEMLEAQLRETASGLHARVATLAELPRLAAAVSTDVATVRDLTQEELAFQPRKGESIAIGQLPSKGPPVLLLSVPLGAPPPPIDRVGTEVRISAGALLLSEVTTVQPRDPQANLKGLVAASWPVPLEALAGKLEAQGITGRIEIGTSQLPIGRAPPVAHARVVTLTLEREPARGVRLALAFPPTQAGRPYAISAALVALASIVVALLLGRRKNEVRAEPGLAQPEEASAKIGAGGTRVFAGAPPVRTTNPAASGPAGSSAGGTGRTIGRYGCVRLLGKGGMAEVFLARATGEAGFEKLVALKVLQPAYAQQLTAVEHFLDEARLVSRLSHPNIVQILDLGRQGDEFFIAMEYVEGADLAHLVDLCRASGSLVPLPVALAIVRKVCDGLHAAHTATGADGAPLGLIHRDVKAGNVFVGRNGSVKIGDFGIAKVANVSRTEFGQVKGTPGYMAPEHRLGHPIDRRADLYGVGALAYELFTGTPVNLDLAALADRGQAGWPHLPPPSAVRRDLPPELDAVVFCALAYDRDKRYPDCAALEEALEAIAIRHPPIAGEKAIGQWIAAMLAFEAGGATQLAPAAR